ncbi:MAG: hypothetical protein RLZ14_585 [Actinomycetota bacterium]
MLIDSVADRVLVSPQQLIEQWRDLEQQLAVFALAVAHVNDAGRWADDGSVTMKSWMRNQLRMSDQQAGGWLGQAGMLNRFEHIGEAALEGVLSQGHLAELRRLDRPKYRNLLREVQSELVEVVSTLDVQSAATACDVWRQRADAVLDEGAPPAEPVRSLSFQRAGDRQLLARLSFDDAAATEFEQAIDTALTWEGNAEGRSLAQRRADALFDVVAFFNRNHSTASTPRHHAHITLSLDASSLDGPTAVHGRTGRLVATECADAALCDCVLHTVLRDPHGTPVGFGRARYTVPRALFRQVAARDGGCRFPGCNRPVAHCEAHHITYWRNGGGTDYGNLVLLCSRHHHLVHRQHLRLALQPDGALDVVWPSGAVRLSQPRGAPPRTRAA